jgi:hypothetical protein
MVAVGFAVWMDDQLAWAQGVHEYRPLGAAVISVTDLFRARDFRAGAEAPARRSEGYVGLFASLGAVNDYLTRRRSAARFLIQQTDRGRRRPRDRP